MKQSLTLVENKFLPFRTKSKLQKKYQTITRCQIKSTPKIRNKTLSLYKLNYTKQYAIPFNEEQDRFEFWGCIDPPKKFNVNKPFLKDLLPKQRNTTGKGQNLMKKYMNRKSNHPRKTVLISIDSTEPIHNLSTQLAKTKSSFNNNIDIKNIRTLDTYNSKQLSKQNYSSTIASEYDNFATETYLPEFLPIKENAFIEKMHSLKEKISERNNLLGHIRSNMHSIRLKKMAMFD